MRRLFRGRRGGKVKRGVLEYWSTRNLQKKKEKEKIRALHSKCLARGEEKKGKAESGKRGGDLSPPSCLEGRKKGKIPNPNHSRSQRGEKERKRK